MIDEKVLDLNITPNQYFIAWCIHEKRKDLFEKLLQTDNEDKIKNDLYKLYIKDFINCELCEVNTFDFDKIKVVNLFDKKEEIKFDFGKFATLLYEKFPKGIKSAGYPVRSGYTDFEKKLRKYIETHKNHSLELIEKAVNTYIDRCKRNNWQYMKLAGYFINKDGVSVLESTCEELLNTKEDDRRESEGDLFTTDL